MGALGTAKYSFSNSPEEASFQRLAYMQRQRYWVERLFQDAKNEAGLDEYQARSWQAWYHHVALVMMAMLFLLRERLEQAEALPLLSTRDVKILLARFLPRGDSGPEEVIRHMQRRHPTTPSLHRFGLPDAAEARPTQGDGESDKVELIAWFQCKAGCSPRLRFAYVAWFH